MADKPYPQDDAGINSLLQNMAAKLGTYTTILPVSNDDVTFILKGADNFQYLLNMTPQVSDTKESFTKFKGAYFDGETNASVPGPPAFPSIAVPHDGVIGIIKGSKSIIRRCKEAPGYTEVIGEDLGWIDTGSEAPVTELVASLSLTAKAGSEVEIKFSKQGMDAMQVEFKRKGDAAWSFAGVYTNSPGVHSTPNTPPDEPESREYRGVLLSKNDPVGEHSPTYTVITSP